VRENPKIGSIPGSEPARCAKCERKRARRAANCLGKCCTEHAEHSGNGGNGERTGRHEQNSQLHVLWSSLHRSPTIYQQWHQPGGMSWLWKNAFTLPGQGHPPIQSAPPTQAADSSDRETLVDHRKNRLGRGRRREQVRFYAYERRNCSWM
jgi:hypothetical protein